ncbi:MAG TPA: hypothetical protein VKB57_14680, partial [Acidimicrobiales bacterium]|nr:hypothetical protein [Acidimicrobiales bacterium]
MSAPEMFTLDDVRDLNAASVARAAAFARVAGSVMVAVGVVGAAAWLWITVRQQAVFNGGSGAADPLTPSRDIDFLRRVDAVAIYVALLVSAVLATAAGLGLRLLADYTVARTGGTLTGFRVGDPLPPPDGDDDMSPGTLPPPPGR